MRAVDPRLADVFEPMLGITFSPTRIRASEKINVIPSEAELKVDCRVPPGLGEEEVRRESPPASRSAARTRTALPDRVHGAHAGQPLADRARS